MDDDRGRAGAEQLLCSPAVRHGRRLRRPRSAVGHGLCVDLHVDRRAAGVVHGDVGLLYGPLIAVLYVGITFAVVAVSVWLVSQDNQAVVIIIYLLCGCTPLIIVLSFLITQLIYMGIGFAIGWPVGAIIGFARRADFPRPGTA